MGTMGTGRRQGNPRFSGAVRSGAGAGWGFRGCGDDGGFGVPVTESRVPAPPGPLQLLLLPVGVRQDGSGPAWPRSRAAPAAMSVQAAVTGAAEPTRAVGAGPRGLAPPPGAITNKAAVSSQLRVRMWGGGPAPARCCRACAAAAPGTGMSGPGGPGPAGAKLDINRAGVAELEGALSGIGRRRARGIVRKREVRGGRGAAGTTPCAETRARDPEAGVAVAVSVPGRGLKGECGGDSVVSVPIAGTGGGGPGSPSPAPSRRGRRVRPPPVLPSLLPGPGRRNRGNAGSDGTGLDGHRVPTAVTGDGGARPCGDR